MAESIKRRLEAGQIVRVLNIGAIPSFKIVELAAHSKGYHGIWIDQEHPGLTQAEIEVLVLACRATGLDSFVRLAPTDYATVMRAMETGSGGVMAAQVRSLAEVKQVVQWAKFPPVGIRGTNTLNFEGGYGTRPLDEFTKSCNAERWLSIQIETVEALDAVEAIAAVPGVDHLFVGPADLSVTLGVPGDFLHPLCRDALKRVSAACQSAGITWGILIRGMEHANFCESLGCKLYAFSSELSVLHAGFKAVRQEYAKFYDA